MENKDIEVLLMGMLKAGDEWHLARTLEKDDNPRLDSEQFGEKK
ncbi:TPA: hypothetical protein ACGH17_004552 [Salmonella enterica subsp. enterica serovar Anatum]